MIAEFDTIGKEFIKAYYARFDEKATRAEVAQFYTVDQSMLSFEGQQFMGQEKIKHKLTEDFPMGSIKRAITKVDCQPMMDGGVLVFVIGQLKGDSENDKPMGYSQVFILKTDGLSWYIMHDVFRLSLHDFGV